jgi:5'-nucleotidase
MLDPAWGVDLIIGGHSHTILEQPAVVNDVLIAQAGVGTDQIGRFDITVGSESNQIVNWKWQLIPVDENLAEPDQELKAFIDEYKHAVDQKYSKVICRLARKLTHLKREEETPLGNLFADIFADRSRADVVLLGGGTICQGSELGPVVTRGDLREVYPYDGPLVKIPVTGAQLANIFAFFMSRENHHEDGRVYQVNGGVEAVYDNKGQLLASLAFDGQPVKDSGVYSACLLEHHYKNSDYVLNVPNGELAALGKPQVVATSAREVLEEYLSTHQNLNSRVEGRLSFTG